MKSPERRIVVETRQPGGDWSPTATIPLDDEQRATVSEWLFDVWFNFSPEYKPSEAPEVAPAEFEQDDQPAFTEPEAVAEGDTWALGMELWGLPDDELREDLEGENGLAAMFVALPEFLEDFEAAVARRFGKTLLTELYARRLDELGYDARVFRNLPPAEQTEYIDRFVPGAPAPVEH